MSNKFQDNNLQLFETIQRLEGIDYEEKFVCFLDVLGYSDLVIDSNSPKEAALPLLILKEIKRIAENRESNLYISLFSDCAYVIADKADADELIEFVAVSCFDVLMDNTHNDPTEYKHHFLRGGITFGEVYYGNNILLGPAIIKACRLEKKAKYPIVIVDSNAEDMLIKSKYKDFIHDNPSNDTRYVDFLTLIHRKNDDTDKPYNQNHKITSGGLNEVYRWVDDKYKEYVKLERHSRDLKEKYGWMGDYLEMKIGALGLWGDSHGEEN